MNSSELIASMSSKGFTPEIECKALVFALIERGKSSITHLNAMIKKYKDTLIYVLQKGVKTTSASASASTTDPVQTTSLKTILLQTVSDAWPTSSLRVRIIVDRLLLNCIISAEDVITWMFCGADFSLRRGLVRSVNWEVLHLTALTLIEKTLAAKNSKGVFDCLLRSCVSSFNLFFYLDSKDLEAFDECQKEQNEFFLSLFRKLSSMISEGLCPPTLYSPLDDDEKENWKIVIQSRTISIAMKVSFSFIFIFIFHFHFHFILSVYQSST